MIPSDTKGKSIPSDTLHEHWSAAKEKAMPLVDVRTSAPVSFAVYHGLEKTTFFISSIVGEAFGEYCDRIRAPTALLSMRE